MKTKVTLDQNALYLRAIEIDLLQDLSRKYPQFHEADLERFIREATTACHGKAATNPDSYLRKAVQNRVKNYLDREVSHAKFYWVTQGFGRMRRNGGQPLDA